MTDRLALPTLISLVSIAVGKPVLSSTVVLGEISIAGTMLKVNELANSLQVCLDAGAKRCYFRLHQRRIWEASTGADRPF